jgi:hypothetical protein
MGGQKFEHDEEVQQRVSHFDGVLKKIIYTAYEFTKIA